MRTYLYIALGGALGALTRFIVKFIFPWNEWMPFSGGTLFVNLSGAFLAFFFFTAAEEAVTMDPDRRLFVGTGLLGSYTTFSALCQDMVHLFGTGHLVPALLYLLVTIFGGILLAYLGHIVARKTIVKWIWTGKNHHGHPSIESGKNA